MHRNLCREGRSRRASGEPANSLDTPSARYATRPFASVIVDGEQVGLSTSAFYTADVRERLSLAPVDEAAAEERGRLPTHDQVRRSTDLSKLVLSRSVSSGSAACSS